MSFHVRRKEREITDADALKKVLKSTKHVTITLCMNNEPYLVSLSHGYGESAYSLYFHCAHEGKKLVYLKANSKVWGQAVLDYGVTDECDYACTSGHFRGKVTLIEDLSEKQYAIKVMIGQLSENPDKKMAQMKPEKLVKTTIGKIVLNYMSGKRHQNPKL